MRRRISCPPLPAAVSHMVRRPGGQAVVVLVLVLGVFVLAAIGIFSYEMNRVQIARSQLQTATEAAALAGGLSLAGSIGNNGGGGNDPTAAQTNAMQVALNLFRRNAILDASLSTATLASSPSQDPPARQANIYMQLINPQTGQAVSLGDPTGKTFNAVGAFGLQPQFGAFLHLPNVVIRAGSLSGVPQLDVVVCFDVSRAMDDQTPIFLYQRVFDPAPGPCWGHVFVAQGTLAQLTNSPAATAANNGSPVNAIFPQALDQAGSFFQFSPALRGAVNTGGPPAQPGTPSQFSDLFVDIDSVVGGNVLQGTGGTEKGFSFARFCNVDEAYQGNLETQAVWNGAQESMHDCGSFVSQMSPGYQNEYLSLAMQCIQPMLSIQ